MRPEPRFSVLVPCYNALPHVETTLASVLPQLGPNDELILQDGNSSDGTVAALQAFLGDHRVSLVSESDRGQSDALNRALARALNNYIVWLNADDILISGALEALRSSLQGMPNARLAWGGHRYIRADGTPIEDFRPQRFAHSLFMRRGCYVFSGSVAIETKLLRESGGFAEDLHYCMDLDLMLTLEESLPSAEVVAVPDVIGALRWHDASKSGSVARPFLREGWRVRGKHMHSLMDHARRVEALIMLSLAHATVDFRHTSTYRHLRKMVFSPLSSIKTSAPNTTVPS